MRIRFLSDIHREFGNQPPNLRPSGEDLIVLAGDIDNHCDGVLWARDTLTHCPVIYVCGNHEMYGDHFDDLIPQMKFVAAGSNVHVLENDAFIFGGIRFLGCTLWTDFDLLGDVTREEAMEYAGAFMNDFVRIRRGQLGQRRALLPIETRERHLESLQWLETEIAASKEPVVVITHHAPCHHASHARFDGDPLSGAFASDLESLMRPPIKAWIFGHTHHCVDRQINGVRVVSNQRGYPNESMPDFDWNRCIEIDAGSAGDVAC